MQCATGIDLAKPNYANMSTRNVKLNSCTGPAAKAPSTYRTGGKRQCVKAQTEYYNKQAKPEVLLQGNMR